MPRTWLHAPCALAMLACNAPEQGRETRSAGESETASETETETESESESDDGENPPPVDLPADGSCDHNWRCPFGHVCVDYMCTPIDELPSCAGPALVMQDQPSANGHVIAFDLVDLQQDGDVEVVAWIHEQGIGVLDNGVWSISEYTTTAVNMRPTIAVVHVDDDPLLDVLLHDYVIDETVSVGLGDGLGNFTMTDQMIVFGQLRGVEVTSDERRAFGYDEAYYEASMLRRGDDGEPIVEGLGYLVHELVPAQLDAEGEDVLFGEAFTAYPMRLRSAYKFDVAEVTLASQGSNKGWLAADLDGDGLDDLLARQRIGYETGEYFTLLSAFANTTDADEGPPSFGPSELARIPDVHELAEAGDFDGDGDDELLFVAGELPGASLVWASDEGLLGCLASIPDFPDAASRMRTGDIDGDGDDELVLLRDNDAMRVLDLQ